MGEEELREFAKVVDSAIKVAQLKVLSGPQSQRPPEMQLTKFERDCLKFYNETISNLNESELQEHAHKSLENFVGFQQRRENGELTETERMLDQFSNRCCKESVIE